jgi:hypothetical protein
MKKTKKPKNSQRDENFQRLCDELGVDVIGELHRAFTLTAAALFRRAKERAEAELKMADQYRTLDC